MKKKLAIFDLDGTLFNTDNVNYNSYKQALSEFGYNLDYDYFIKECNGNHYKVFLPGLINGELELMEGIHKRKKQIYKSNLNLAIVNEYLFDIIKGLRENYYLAVVSNASKKNCEDILSYFAKLDLFDLIITHDDVVEVKPSPEGFNRAMQEFSIGPENTVIFEDSEVGIEAAKLSGAAIFIVNSF